MCRAANAEIGEWKCNCVDTRERRVNSRGVDVMNEIRFDSGIMAKNVRDNKRNRGIIGEWLIAANMSVIC